VKPARARHFRTLWLAAAVLLAGLRPGWALDPHKSLTQYSRTVWTQHNGLPQDTVRAIAQTADDYLWVGTDEGLARFDGYDFQVFDKANGDLPANSITALAATKDGALWIGTSNGLTLYRDKQFHTYTTQQGLPDNSILALYEDHPGDLWVVAGAYLSRFQNGKFTTYAPGSDLPGSSVRSIREDLQHNLWIGGLGSLARMEANHFVPVLDDKALNGGVVSSMLADHKGNFWAGGSKGIVEIAASGKVRRYDIADGLPDSLVRDLLEDRDGVIWAGTNGGLARLEGERFVAVRGEDTQEAVRCLFEDREGNLWVGSSSGLIRLRDDLLTVYGKSEGLPGDPPNSVFQDRTGRLWVGFHDGGLLLFSGAGAPRLFTPRDGLPNSEIFSIRQARNDDLLICSRAGLVRMHEGRFETFVPPDPLARAAVFDALEDSTGRLWLATGGGLMMLEGGRARFVIASPPPLNNSIGSLCEGRDGSIWAGTFGKGLWRIHGEESQQYTTTNGLSSDQIRSMYQDSSGTLWIGTFDGGLNALKDGRFTHFTARDGLLSDNVADVEDDGVSLWLSTSRGICRIAKKQLQDFAEHRRATLDPINYGVEDGLRSAQCAPSYPIGGGGHRTSDGRLWFTTSAGLAVYDPKAPQQRTRAPQVRLVELTADERRVDLAHPARLGPEIKGIEFRYTGLLLSGPERVRYSYRLENLDTDWVNAGNRRVQNYNSLRHGSYRFTVRAGLPGGPVSEASYAFVVLPHFYETAWFRLLCAAGLLCVGWAVYQLRLRQIRYRFALVLEERARLAREIHDTLAQGFVGIASQLDAVAMCMPEADTPARKFLDLARRMARHSLTEARRSVMDLRASALEGQDLAAALKSGTRMWTAGSPVAVNVDVSGAEKPLPQEMEQHLLRIAQEAVTNVLKHAGASQIWIKLHMEARKLQLRIIDNGHGFDQQDVFASRGGHFGVLGMRERAERLGGELHLASHPGEGTEVEVKVPLP
jgi:signal transduction histidine kinase/ligand-binding sensor domain-containing protein